MDCEKEREKGKQGDEIRAGGRRQGEREEGKDRGRGYEEGRRSERG